MSSSLSLALKQKLKSIGIPLTMNRYQKCQLISRRFSTTLGTTVVRKSYSKCRNPSQNSKLIDRRKNNLAGKNPRNLEIIFFAFPTFILPRENTRHPESPPVTHQTPSKNFRTLFCTDALLTFCWARDL